MSQEGKETVHTKPYDYDREGTLSIRFIAGITLAGIAAVGLVDLTLGQSFGNSNDLVTARPNTLPPLTASPDYTASVTTSTVFHYEASTSTSFQPPVPDISCGKLTEGSIEYGINPDDTIFSIADKYKVTVMQLLAVNPCIRKLTDISQMKKLIIPSPTSTTTTLGASSTELSISDTSLPVTDTSIVGQPTDEKPIGPDDCIKKGGHIVSVPVYNALFPVDLFRSLYDEGLSYSERDIALNHSSMKADFSLTTFGPGDECVPNADTVRSRYINVVATP